jgi:glycosyltransferase involved in cell wall biosynthesis
LGGSETALIRLAEELFLERNLLCTVYGRIDNPGYYNGVRYRPLDGFRPEVGVDTLVAWRYPEAADLPLRAKRLLLWMHDTDAGDRLTPVRAARFEQIVVLTEWHREHMLRTYPWLDPDKLVIIGNGVDLERFAPAESRRGGIPAGAVTAKAPKREPHRVAYTSSPDRGLDAILALVWPKVVERVPDAELHVYYGWKAWDAGAVPQELVEYRQQVANLLIDSRNVVSHGRVSQAELAADLLRTSVWLHPSVLPQMAPWNGAAWHETYCINAVEAQVAGAIPVTTNVGALAETVASGIVIEGVLGRDEGVAEQYADAIVNLLLTPESQLRRLRDKVRKNAPAESWTEVAHQWAGLLAPAGLGTVDDGDTV